MKSQSCLSPQPSLWFGTIKPVDNAKQCKSTLQFDMVVMPTEKAVLNTRLQHRSTTVLLPLACPEICTDGQENLRFHCPVTLLPAQRFSKGILRTQLHLLLLSTDRGRQNLYSPLYLSIGF